MSIKEIKDFEGVYWFYHGDEKKLVTLNLVPGKKVYGEDLINFDNHEYRIWAMNRSKLGAAIYKGISEMPIKKGSKILYLGVSSGTTASHISDIVSENGIIYCVDFSPRSIRDFVVLCEDRKNLIPILADARFPESYRMLIEEVEGIYMDVAQPNQAEILINNAKMFLKSGGWIMLCVKSQSIDVSRSPDVVYEEQKQILEKNNFDIKEMIKLNPFSLDHAFIYAKYKV